MKLQRFILLLTVAIFSIVADIPVHADRWNDLKKKVKEEAEKILDKGIQELNSGLGNKAPAQNNQPKQTPRNAYRQGKIEIDTGNPNLRIEVLKCEGFGDKAYLSLMLQNVSDKDTNINIQGGQCSAVDGSGRTIERNNRIAIRIGRDNFNSYANLILPGGIKAKIIVQVSDISESATFLKSIKLFNPYGNFGDIVIKNIDINHE